ncbi:MAG: polyprenyl synthetase family protein [Thermoanaerobacteraceae bacterium]|nr:polyprenyl synthetase family protein [Thermoanaerobacteraceae bacterium]
MCGDNVHRQILGEIEEELLTLEEDLLAWVNTNIILIKQPLKDMIASGGKRLRPAMVLAASRFGNYNFDNVRQLAVSVELIHTATLIHDDIIDDSPLRRGIPSIQSRLGKDVAVFAGDFVFCKVFELYAFSGHFDLLRIVAKTLHQICEGEIKQREDLFNINLTFKDYLFRVKRKTAMLFALSAELGARASKAPEKTIRALHKYGMNLGIAFQIIDDLLDFNSDNDKLGKPVGADIREGVITLPTIYALKYSGQKSCLKKILAKRYIDEAEVIKAVEIVKDSGGLTYAKFIAEKYINKAQQSIAQLPDIPIKKVLANISALVINRSK